MPITNVKSGISALSELSIDAIKNWAGMRIDNVGAPDTSDDVPRARAGDILAERFGMPRMPDGTSGQVLTAQGAGVDPAYAAPAGVPSGAIIMWAGTIANIPAGYVICDGNNSTPNLLAKFVEGVATAATNPGTTGGATSKTTAGHVHTTPAVALSIAQLAAHTHTVDLVQGTAGSNPVAMAANQAAAILSTSSSVGSGSTHAHGNTGSNTDSIADIRPLYYDIAFIMKT